MGYCVYTDGSYKDSIGSGGWAAIIVENDKVVKKLYQGFKNTTNNRMEIRAVLETLMYFKEPTEIHIVSDSAYVINSIVNKHVYKWFKDQDFSKKNLDLWFQMIDLLDFHTVTFEWVKGHNANKYNEMADMYAQHAAQCLNLQEDVVYDSQI